MIIRGDFSNESDVYDSCRMSEKDREEFEVLYAFLHSASYSESMDIVLRHRETGDLYHHSDSHCSCDGFGPFTPSLTSKEYILRLAEDDAPELEALISTL